MIDRRTLLFLGGAAVAVARPATAQQPKRLPVVAIVSSVPLVDLTGADPKNKPTGAFLAGLRSHGWIEGQNIAIERRSVEGKPEHAPAVLRELLTRGVDVIFLGGTGWLHSAALAATQSVPLVALFAGDPVVDGFVTSLARPGGNITGVTRTAGAELYGKWLQLLRDIAPSAVRPAFLASGEIIQSFHRITIPSGLSVLPIRVEVPDGLDAAFATIVREKADSLIVSTGPQFHSRVQRIATFASEQKLPGVYALREVVEVGGLMSYGPSVLAQFRQAASYAHRILNGAKPAELPVEQPTTFELVINARTAKALGLAIPSSLLVQAEEVIE